MNVATKADVESQAQRIDMVRDSLMDARNRLASLERQVERLLQAKDESQSSGDTGEPK